MLPFAAESLIDKDLLVPLGGAAGALAMLGMLLLLPLFVTQRREVMRLLRWQERDPRAGEPEAQAAAAHPTTGSMSAAAARVTSERPALARIGTAERDAIELERIPFWRRVVERGPRHPFVISIVALLLAGGIFVAASQFLRADDSEAPAGRAIDPADVEVVFLNASSTAGVAGQVADDVEAAGFVVAETTVASDTQAESVVRYAPGAKAEARAVKKRLGILSLLEFDAEAEAAANDAPVVVIVGEDLARASGGSG